MFFIDADIAQKVFINKITNDCFKQLPGKFCNDTGPEFPLLRHDLLLLNASKLVAHQLLGNCDFSKLLLITEQDLLLRTLQQSLMLSCPGVFSLPLDRSLFLSIYLCDAQVEFPKLSVLTSPFFVKRVSPISTL